MRRFSWERISWIIKIPSRTPRISPWRKFDITTKLMGEQNEINNVDKNSLGEAFMETTVIDWWWNNYQSSTRKSPRLFRFCVVSWEDTSESWIQRNLEEKDRMDYIFSKLQRLWQNQWSRLNSSGTSSQDSQRCNSAVKVTDLLSRLGETPKTFTERILFVSMSNDISCDGKGDEEECLANAKVVSILAKEFGIGQWSLIGPGSEKKWYSMEENSPQGILDHIAEKMLLEFAESGCPIFRATTPLSRCKLKSKRHGKLSTHFAADKETIETIFLQNCFCQSAQSLRSSRGNVWSIWIPSRSIKATWCIDGTINCSQWNQNRSSFGEWHPSHQNLLLQRYEERIELL